MYEDFAMVEAFNKPYLDSNLYIATIQGPQSEDPARVQLAAEIFQLAESGSFSVYASTFIEAEVIKAPGVSTAPGVGDPGVLRPRLHHLDRARPPDRP